MKIIIVVHDLFKNFADALAQWPERLRSQLIPGNAPQTPEEARTFVHIMAETVNDEW